MDKVGDKANSNSVVSISLNAMNKQGLPDESNRILHIEWNPSSSRSPETISYIFDLKR